MIKNILLEVEYDGTNFSGYQIQPNLRTVEGELIKAIEKAVSHKVNLISAGRTDKGVHSLGQIVNFKTESNIPASNYKSLMKFLLPGDISIKNSKEVNIEFHSRFDAKFRKYKYIVYNRTLINALYRNYSYHFPYYLDVELMNKAAKKFIGTHNFTSFKTTSHNLERVNPIRTIKSFEVYRDGDFVYFEVVGNAFLHNMVRIMVGTLLYIGTGKLSYNSLDEIIKSKDRGQAGITAGPQGLYLEKVFYK